MQKTVKINTLLKKFERLCNEDAWAGSADPTECLRRRKNFRKYKKFLTKIFTGLTISYLEAPSEVTLNEIRHNQSKKVRSSRRK